MANDSGLFETADKLTDAEFNGWSYTRDGKEYLPLYEGKMVSHYDHRFATYRGATQAQLNKGTLPRFRPRSTISQKISSHSLATGSAELRCLRSLRGHGIVVGYSAGATPRTPATSEHSSPL